MDNRSENEDARLNHELPPSTVQGAEGEEGAQGAGEQESAPVQGSRRSTADLLSIAIPAAVGAVGLILLVVWLLGYRSGVEVAPRAGMQEGTETAVEAEDEFTDDEGDWLLDALVDPDDETDAAGSEGHETGAAPAASAPAAAPRAGGRGGSWPAFRGSDRMGMARGETGLASSWPQGGPRKLWSVKMLGPGHGGAAIEGGRVYVLDYDRSARQDVLRALSLSDGSEIWRQGYSVDIRDNHGISRTVPAVSNGYVVALGPMGHVTCVRADSGAVVWQVDLRQAYGTTIPTWYTGQCPLIDDGRAIVAPGGSALMVAIDLAGGKVAWETRNSDGWDMTHASIMPMQISGTKVYVYPATGGVAAVSASDGSVAWKYPRWTVNTANVPTPVPVGDDRIFLTGGYGAGSMLLSARGGTPSQIWKIPQNVFGSHQHTPVLYQNHLYGVAMDRQLVCLGLDGERVWSSGHTARFGIGPYLLADGKIYVLSDDGTLVMAQASTSGYNELARAKVLPGPDAWAPMALADGVLVLRDRDTMIALDVRNP